ncbi:MAG: hypothetical protein FJ164_08930 [Gammaproteobacteria bacterium]|nr:hypothetical protein [Gammaproteobacteria bacterium]
MPRAHAPRSVILSLLCATVVCPPPLHATDEAGNYAVWGIGQASCNQFVKAAESDATEDFGHYLAGYLTAINTVTAGVHRIGEGQSTKDGLATLQKYCVDHRMDSFERALQAVLRTEGEAGAGSKSAPDATWGRPPSPQ